MYTLYADETKDESCGRITVAGYLIGSNQLKALTEKWNRALAEGPLDYFHAYEYAKSHPDIHRSLCNLINHDHIVAGFATSLIPELCTELPLAQPDCVMLAATRGQAVVVFSVLSV